MRPSQVPSCSVLSGGHARPVGECVCQTVLCDVAPVTVLCEVARVQGCESLFLAGEKTEKLDVTLPKPNGSSHTKRGI